MAVNLVSGGLIMLAKLVALIVSVVLPSLFRGVGLNPVRLTELCGYERVDTC